MEKLWASDGVLEMVELGALMFPEEELMGMRSPTEFEHPPGGGAGEVAVYEAYLEAGFWGVIPSLIGEVSSFFGFCPSQLTPLTWRTLMAIQNTNSWSLEIDLITRKLREDPGVIWGPEGRGGPRRVSLDPEIALGARRSFYRSCDHEGSPEAV
ncbi:hypothetical protein F2Q70_00011696 [Brassica cretica]|uniref:Uncharacterized protein n=1 Tax=Brassica cretica TaxID=69181 RepID=A0A8S9ME75_BRACR|nr:hypothetical protein F2Q70_00011696 [Brassica cretica]